MNNIKQSKAELEALCDFTEIYDQYRFVDPITSNVYVLQDGKVILSDEAPCYKTWRRDGPCANCISRRACRDQTQYFKLEYVDDRVLMIISKPVVVNERQFSLELLRDVTDSMVVHDACYHNHEQMKIAELIEKVNYLSISDVFTGLYNNAYMKNKMSALVCGMYTTPFSILILDIDLFKHVNDCHGHLAGDAVILTIAASFKKYSALAGCSIGRMGGDEFCFILEDCDLPKANAYAQEIAQSIHSHHYEGRAGDFQVEVSIGVGEYDPGEELTAFIERVDCALYDEKHNKEIARSL